MYGEAVLRRVRGSAARHVDAAVAEINAMQDDMKSQKY
jgi:hypothetical protein